MAGLTNTPPAPLFPAFRVVADEAAARGAAALALSAAHVEAEAGGGGRGHVGFEQVSTPRQLFFRIVGLWLFVLRIAQPLACRRALSDRRAYTSRTAPSGHMQNSSTGSDSDSGTGTHWLPLLPPPLLLLHAALPPPPPSELLAPPPSGRAASLDLCALALAAATSVSCTQSTEDASREL